MSLSFCAIPNSNMTNTLSHIHTKPHSESSSTDASRKSLVWVGSGAGWAEHACRKPVCVCVPHSPGWACMDSRHWEQTAEGFPIIPCSPYRCTLRTTHHHHGSQCLKTKKKATVVHILTDNPNQAPMTNMFVPE